MGEKKRSSLKPFFSFPLWNELRNLFLLLICFYQLVAKSDQPRLSNPSPMITCHWLSLDNWLLGKKQVKRFAGNLKGTELRMVEEQELQQAALQLLLESSEDAKLFPVPHKPHSHAWNTAVFSHKLWAPFGSHRQQDQSLSSCSCLGKDELLAQPGVPHPWGQTLCGLSSLEGAELICPCLCKVSVLLQPLGLLWELLWLCPPLCPAPPVYLSW